MARHVLAIRSQLTPEQRKSLMGLCAKGVVEDVRRRQGWGWRDAGGASTQPDDRGGKGRGRWRGGRGQAGGGGPEGR